SRPPAELRDLHAAFQVPEKNPIAGSRGEAVSPRAEGQFTDGAFLLEYRKRRSLTLLAETPVIPLKSAQVVAGAAVLGRVLSVEERGQLVEMRSLVRLLGLDHVVRVFHAAIEPLLFLALAFLHGGRLLGLRPLALCDLSLLLFKLGATALNQEKGREQEHERR